MEEETTTNAPADAGAIQGVPVDSDGNALPDQTAPAAAESTTTGNEETQPQSQAITAPAASSEDDELATWAQNKGLELDSDNAKKIAKVARDNELAFKKKAQQTSELQRSVGDISDSVATNEAAATGQDPEILRRLQRMEVENSVSKFWNENPEAKAYEQQMVEIIAQKPYLAGDLPVLYAYAKGQDTSTVKRDVLTDLAHRQQTAVPTGSATNTQTMSGTQKITPQNVDKLVGEHDLEWFKANQTAINAAMSA